MITEQEAIRDFISVQNADGEQPTTVQIIVKHKPDFQPMVSVIMPVYNVEKYLEQCLQTLCAQSLHEIEIICIDDGSVDNSMQILQAYASQDKRITILKQQNSGAGIARNAGIAAASGKYLSFLDSDDFFEADMLEKAVKEAEKQKCDIVIFNSFNFDEQTQSEQPSYPYNETYIKNSPWPPARFPDKLYFIAPPAPWNKLFRRELIMNKNIRFENLSSCNDITFVNTALSVAGKISVINNCLIHYRRNTCTNISANREKHAENILYAFKKLQQNLKKHGLFKTFNTIFYKQLQVRADGETKKCSEQAKKDFLSLQYTLFPETAPQHKQKRRKPGIFNRLIKIFIRFQ